MISKKSLFFRHSTLPAHQTQEIKAEKTKSFLEEKIRVSSFSWRGEGAGPESEESGHGQTGEDLGLCRHPVRDWLQLQRGSQSKQLYVQQLTSINNSDGVQALFKQAMRHWENFTCIQFVERTTEHPNWIGKTWDKAGNANSISSKSFSPSLSHSVSNNLLHH